MCVSSDGSREPAHKRTLCRKDVINWVYELRYLLFDFDTYRNCFVIMCNYLAAYSHVYFVACSNMRALLHAYLDRLEPLDLFFV